MRFISFTSAEGEGVGVRCADGYHGLSVRELGTDLREVLGQGIAAVTALSEKLAAAPRLDESEVRLLPPIPRPDKIFCIGLNYRAHALETGQAIPDHPTVFTRYPTSLVGHGAPLRRPSASVMFDYEAELAVVIGKGGRNISRETALDHVAGYTVCNDGSIRDFQMRTSQWTMGKNFDQSGSIGPELVTPDELAAGARGLKIEARVNGRTLQSANTDDLIFDVEALIEALSQVLTLAPGDLIITGTPGGVGALRTPPIWLEPGDVCEIEIGGIGVLANRVAQEAGPSSEVQP